MKTKTKAIIALTAGVLLIGLGLYYGVSGDMHSSISRRGENIARWEKELVKDKQEIEVFLAEMDTLGKKTDATPEERDRFQSGMARMDQMTDNLRHSREMIEDERDRKQQQTLITAGMSAVGILAILFGVVLLRRSKRNLA